MEEASRVGRPSATRHPLLLPRLTDSRTMPLTVRFSVIGLRRLQLLLRVRRNDWFDSNRLRRPRSVGTCSWEGSEASSGWCGTRITQLILVAIGAARYVIERVNVLVFVLLFLK